MFPRNSTFSTKEAPQARAARLHREVHAVLKLAADSCIRKQVNVKVSKRFFTLNKKADIKIIRREILMHLKTKLTECQRERTVNQI